MARTCTVCTHPDVDEINRRLLAGEPYRSVAKHFEASESAVYRHRSEGHIPHVLAKAEEAQTVARADNLLAELQAVRERAMSLLDKAEKAGNTRAYGPPSAYLREIRELFKLLAELEGKLAAQNQVTILINNPAWVELRTLIVEAVEPYPEARAAIIRAIADYNGDLKK